MSRIDATLCRGIQTAGLETPFISIPNLVEGSVHYLCARRICDEMLPSV